MLYSWVRNYNKTTLLLNSICFGLWRGVLVRRFPQRYLNFNGGYLSGNKWFLWPVVVALWFAGPPAFFETWLGQAICFLDFNRVKVSAKTCWGPVPKVSYAPAPTRIYIKTAVRYVFKVERSVCIIALVMDFEHSTDWKVDLVFSFF